MCEEKHHEIIHDAPAMQISAVIPAYNAAPYLPRALESVLRQSIQPKEIILVDDGSTDVTAEVAHRYKRIVRYIYQENRGCSGAMNRGIREARGDWIAFLDADDEWLPQHLQTGMDILARHPHLRWFGANVRHRLEGSGKIIPHAQPIRARAMMVENDYFRDYLAAVPPYGHFSTPTMIIHRSVFEKLGVFDTDLFTGMDRKMWFVIGLHYPEIGYSPQPSAIVWKRQGSITATKRIDPARKLKAIRDAEATASALGARAVERAVPRLRFWLVQTIRAAIASGDSGTLKQVMDLYGQHLQRKWRGAGSLYLSTPRLSRPVVDLWNRATRGRRAWKDD